MNAKPLAKTYQREREAEIPCDNVMCAYHDNHSSQNCCASYATYHDPPGLCSEYIPIKQY